MVYCTWVHESGSEQHIRFYNLRIPIRTFFLTFGQRDLVPIRELQMLQRSDVPRDGVTRCRSGVCMSARFFTHFRWIFMSSGTHSPFLDASSDLPSLRTNQQGLQQCLGRCVSAFLAGVISVRKKNGCDCSAYLLRSRRCGHFTKKGMHLSGRGYTREQKRAKDEILQARADRVGYTHYSLFLNNHTPGVEH